MLQSHSKVLWFDLVANRVNHANLHCLHDTRLYLTFLDFIHCSDCTCSTTLSMTQPVSNCLYHHQIVFFMQEASLRRATSFLFFLLATAQVRIIAWYGSWHFAVRDRNDSPGHRLPYTLQRLQRHSFYRAMHNWAIHQDSFAASIRRTFATYLLCHPTIERGLGIGRSCEKISCRDVRRLGSR